ncbi:MAG TPA: pitrilysin family protein [Gemmatimonadales bacterium]|nr:pitrilysin family protein [Gemmatimonadales bacterium]
MRAFARPHSLVLALAALGGAALPAAQAQQPSAAPARPAAPPAIEIPYRKFVLENGLTLLVHEDRKAPIVAVNVWYHVGSKNERPGRTGFAHLFEHLMFNGSEHFNDDYFKTLEAIGATDLNGTTNEDRTNYFQNVPTSALDAVLWMESDRMGHLLGAVDQAKLDEQRGVVQNEKRQGENQPYGRVWDFLTPKLFPANHPYSWTVIGSMEDLGAARLEDVRQWFQDYYGAANAVIVLAGDIDAETARRKVERYFGDIPSGPPVAKQEVNIAKRTGSQRGVMQDRVPQARIYKVWNIPQWGSRDGELLNLVSDVLASGKTSRLYRRLVYDDQTATNVSAYVDLREIAGLFVIEATVKPGGDPAEVERAIDQELERLLRTGPTPTEVRRVKTQYRASFLRGIERIGGFGGKSDVLAAGQVYLGRPDHYKQLLAWVEGATAADLQRVAREWLSDGVYTLEVHPFPEYRTVASTVDRSKVPEPGPPPDARFPAVVRDTLSNGLAVVLAERQAIPQVNFTLLVDAGYAADQGTLPGTASMAMAMLDEGTRTRNALQISEELALLGAQLATSSGLDMSSVYLSALKENLDASLALYADVILNPSFPSAELERQRRQRIAQIQREKVQPVQMALRVFPKLLYGEGHAYSNPLTGSGTEESVAKMTRQHLVDFHRTWFRPNNATLVVVGATTMAELKPKLERLFAGWRPGEVPAKNVGPVEPQAASTVYLLDRPGALQTVIFAGNVAPPKANPDETTIEVMNAILGGNFTSRVNMNLREDKHWSYGAFTFLWDARGQRPFVAYAPVQTDKTKESIAELAKELRQIIQGRPVEPAELSLAQNSLTLTLPGSWETMDAVGASLANIVTYGLDDRFYDTYAEKVKAVTAPEVQRVAAQVIHPDRLVWVVVGDRSKIESGIRELGLGEIRFLDADGRPLATTTP